MHILDRPVWSALTSCQAQVSVGGDFARKYHADIGPLASARDDRDQSLRELAELIPPDGRLTLLQADPVVLPTGVEAVMSAKGVQLVFEDRQALPSVLDDRMQRLTEEDIPAMVELATLTKPGPFAKGTSSLGEFWGIKEGGRLLAMAGERMKQPGYTEVSAVCAHPDARGKGFARALSAIVVTHILARNEIPYLHSYAANTAAIRLYESLGFRVRCGMGIAILGRSTAQEESDKLANSSQGDTTKQ